MKTNLLGFVLIFFAVFFTHAQQSQDTIVIENVNVVPMTSEIVLYNHRVLISAGKIIKIEPASHPIKNKTTVTIDGTGKYLIPGLSEMHYHYRSDDIQSDFKLLIANGITNVRNMAEFENQDHIAIKRKVSSGELLGPNYFTTGPYLSNDDLQTIDDVVAIVEKHKKRGYDFLKIAASLPQPIYLKLLEECEVNKIPIVGHAQRTLPLEFSLRMKSIEHVEEFLYLSDGTNDTYFKQSESNLQLLAKQLHESGIYIGTTLSVFEFITACLNDEKFTNLQKHDHVKYLAKNQREGFLTEKNDYRKLKNQTFSGFKAPVLFDDYFLWIQKFSKLLSDNHVNLLTGSDTYGMVIVGFSLHREFTLLQRAGMSPYKILLASTVNPSRYLNQYAFEGTITEGKNANMVLLNRNPLDDIENTKSIEMVFLKGKWYDRKVLDKMLEEVQESFK
ncbi:amidohydrolase family protein [Flavobacterium orientale]|uniref:Amidohydrolase n=1 Tax=Flavobacterium orientale TaxID=1756020 RepID=A0A916XVM2_9FLAO|nr:amidohydrolase family protein [Flavobacterium orientale]GGD15247.1 amidohydrolase [Flavobacterium orientale]